MPGLDYYAVLEVPPGASPEAIQAAYRLLCKRYHPDTHLPSASAERMVLLNEAYGVLSNGARRREYDGRYTRERRKARATRIRAVERELVLAPDLAIPLVRVPAGDFLMGGGNSDPALCHNYPLYLDEYYIGMFPVTVAQYGAFSPRNQAPCHALGTANVQH